MNVDTRGGKCTIRYSDEPPREGVKPCANYMYESLKTSPYSQIVCVVLTGMGADGTKGIVNLETAKRYTSLRRMKQHPQYMECRKV